MVRVALTTLRPQLAKWIRHVQQPEEFVVITAHNREVAALISMRNLDLLFQQWDEHRIGPINPATGRPFGREWVVAHFQGHYQRHRDPEAHLHPRRQDCPWLGRPFEWPPKGATDATPPPGALPMRVQAPRPDPPEAPEEAPAPARRWWPWRR